MSLHLNSPKAALTIWICDMHLNVYEIFYCNSSRGYENTLAYEDSYFYLSILFNQKLFVHTPNMLCFEIFVVKLTRNSQHGSIKAPDYHIHNLYTPNRNAKRIQEGQIKSHAEPKERKKYNKNKKKN